MEEIIFELLIKREVVKVLETEIQELNTILEKERLEITTINIELPKYKLLLDSLTKKTQDRNLLETKLKEGKNSLQKLLKKIKTL